MLTQIPSLVMSLLMMFPSSNAVAAVETAFDITSETVPLYLASLENEDEIKLYFKDGIDDIPYIELETAQELILTVMAHKGDDGFELSLSYDDNTAIFERENGSHAVIDFADGLIGWDDCNLFTAQSYSLTSLDLLEHTGVSSEGEPELFERNLRNTLIRPGTPIAVRLTDYDIETICQDGMYLLPLQTVSDLFIAHSYYSIGYNSEAVFIFKENDPGDMYELYYSVVPSERSEELAEFNYNEMCLLLDFGYGLLDEHDITSFDEFFDRIGLEESLKSTDPVEATLALNSVIFSYIADLHSTFNLSSPYAGELPASLTLYPDAMAKFNKASAKYASLRPETIEAYEEIGNTAYITFDSFAADYDNDYYGALESDTMIDDTIGIIMYAHERITRENSPIENIVLDLSLNTGGLSDAAIYTIAWFLGDCTLYAKDTGTDSQAAMSYRIDVNGDRVFDQSDSVAHLNRYCIISPVSFSCGNLVPSAFKDSGDVTLLGRRSGGGTCSVLPFSTADGTLWTISGRICLSSVVNGVYYNIDRGIEPDFVIDKPASFYDRAAMTEYLNGLF